MEQPNGPLLGLKKEEAARHRWNDETGSHYPTPPPPLAADTHTPSHLLPSILLAQQTAAAAADLFFSFPPTPLAALPLLPDIIFLIFSSCT